MGDRDDHAREARGERQGEPPPLAQLPEVELTPRLEPHHEEEERHEAAVDPLPQGQGDLGITEADREVGRPHPFVGGDVDVGPDEGEQRAGDEDGGAPGLGPQEPLQGRASRCVHSVIPVKRIASCPEPVSSAAPGTSAASAPPIALPPAGASHPPILLDAAPARQRPPASARRTSPHAVTGARSSWAMRVRRGQSATRKIADPTKANQNGAVTPYRPASTPPIADPATSPPYTAIT